MWNGLIPFSPIDFLHNPGQITQPLKASPFPSAKWKQNGSSSVCRWPQDLWRKATDTPKWVLHPSSLALPHGARSQRVRLPEGTGERGSPQQDPRASESSAAELGSTQHTQNTPCQAPPALSSASRSVLAGLATHFPG